MRLKDMPPELAAKRREVLRKLNGTPERKQYMREWYAANKSRHRELGRKWQSENRERYLELCKIKYRRNLEENKRKHRALYHQARGTPLMITKGLYGGVARRARRAKIALTITKTWILGRVNAGICEVSGLPFVCGDGIHHPFSPTIDRIRRDDGYTPENSRLVLWAINNLKGTGDDATMWAIVDAMVANRAKLAQ